MITEATQKFISLIKKSNIKDFYVGENLSRIQVDTFISKIAFIYEKIRNAIDYKEDHLLRKNAVERIIWRRLNIKLSIEDIGLALIKELIRAGYLENNLIPESKVKEVDGILTKYLTLLNLSGNKMGTVEGGQLARWLLSLAACEIEETLVPPLEHQALVSFAYKVLGKEVKIVDDKLKEEEKQLQILIALNRALVKADTTMVSYLIWKYYNPNWLMANHQQVLLAAKKIKNIKAVINNQLKYYLSEKLLRLFKKYGIIFQVLREIILENPSEAERIFNDPAELEFLIRTTCEGLYRKARTKLRRSIFRVIIYIFITKMLLVLLLELPYEIYLSHSPVVYLPLMVNALFPPVLMFLIGLIIKVPSKKNTQMVVKVTEEMVYKGQLQSGAGIGGTIKRSALMSFIFSLLYLILFTASFGFIIYVLVELSFTVLSIAIFLLFLSLVSFFGIKIRQGVRELVIVSNKENPLAFLLNLLSLPFLRVGYWISIKFAKINLFVFIFDFIIEAPFKVFLEVIEDWITFLKEKKEEIYNQQQ